MKWSEKLSEKKMLILFAIYQNAGTIMIVAGMALLGAWALLSGISDQVGNSIAVANF